MTAPLATQQDLQPAPNAPPRFAVQAVLGLRGAMLRATQNLVPPLALWNMIAGVAFTQLIGLMARLGIADLLAQGPKSVEELAERTGLHTESLHRALRGLASQNVFRRRDDGLFENSALSEALRADQAVSMRDFAIYFASKSNCDAWGALEHTLRTGDSGFVHVHGMSVWDWFEQHADERDTFARSMMNMTRLEATGIAKAFDFDSVQRLGDVGGGRGTLLVEILAHHPKLRGMLVEAPGLIAQAQVLAQARGVAARLDGVPGSFFEDVPPGCDAYLMKTVLHDWDDARCLKILGNVRRAMQPGHRLLVCEALLEPDEVSDTNLADLQMMVVCDNGRERSRADFERLLHETGFQLREVHRTPSPTCLIEAVAV